MEMVAQERRDKAMTAERVVKTLPFMAAEAAGERRL
jgi:hypothetical protein